MAKNTFSKRLIELRTKKGVKREEIAKLLNCSVSAIANYENGNRTPDFDALISLADYFDTTTDYLLGRTDIKTDDKDLQFVCNYIGLDEDTVNNFIKFKNYLLLPTGREYITIIPTFLAYTKTKYYEMFNKILNDFLQSKCLINIIISCCVEKILEYSLNELGKFENVYIKKLSQYKQEKISAFYNISENYFQQHKLNLINAQDTVADFIKSATELENIEEDEIENILKYIELEIYRDDENIFDDKDTDSEPLLYGYSVNDLESIADCIIDNDYNSETVLKNINEQRLFKNDKEMQIYLTSLERVISNKKDGDDNGNDS